MTAATLDFGPASTTRAPRQSFLHLLRTERISLFSLRGTLVSAIVGTAVAIAISVMYTIARIAISNSMGTPLSSLKSEALSTVEGTSMVFAVIAVVVGASAFGREQSSGALGTLLAAAPRRMALLSAKAVVIAVSLAVWTFVAGALVVGAAALTEIIMGVSASPFDVKDAPLILPGTALICALTGVFSLAVATLLRSDRWATSIMLVFLLVIPTILFTVPVEWVQTAAQYHFSNAQMAIIHPTDDVAENVRNILVTFAWPAVFFAGALTVFSRRDA